MPAPKIFTLLAHPITQEAIQSLSKGSDPRGVLAGIAGDLVAQEVAKMLGTAHKSAAQAAAPGVKRRAKSSKVEERESDVIDAEYTVVNEAHKGSKKAG